MPTPWLLLDANYLCYRAAYSTGGLSFENIQTGVAFGLLKEVVALQEEFKTNKFVFCFDYGISYRVNQYPTYKSNRKPASEEDKELRSEISKQIRLIREEYLPAIGFKNILYHDGFEADDLIASICKHLKPIQTAIIVSSDHDLFQLLNNQVSMWLPSKKTLYTDKKFQKEYGITPAQWVQVKAMAGCTSDTIDGIRGIGEGKACKYLRGELKEDSKSYQSIINNTAIIEKNLPIVELPYVGTPQFQIEKDKINPKDWNKIAKKLGMRTLVGAFPMINPQKGLLY